MCLLLFASARLELLIRSASMPTRAPHLFFFDSNPLLGTRSKLCRWWIPSAPVTQLSRFSSVNFHQQRTILDAQTKWRTHRPVGPEKRPAQGWIIFLPTWVKLISD